MRRHATIQPITEEGAIAAWYTQRAHAAAIEAYDGRVADIDRYLRTVSRLARWLRWRDGRIAAMASEGKR